MFLGTLATLLLGSLAFWWGIRCGRLLLRQGATANDLFKGKNALSLAYLGLYFSLLLLVVHVPQLQSLPLELRVYGMQISWVVMRVMLLGFCGVGFIVSWRTARSQVLAVGLIGLLGLGGFTATENYFLAPIYGSLTDNLKSNGVFQQTSSSSCAPAALATILHRWGIDAGESGVAKAAGTSRLGTSMPQLIVAARAFGMDGLELSPTWEQMQQINRPGVLATWLFSGHRKQAHATALLGLNEQFAAIADPAFGRIYQVHRKQFDRIWRDQYVPIFQSEDIVVSEVAGRNYLQQLGYLSATSTDLQLAIQRFQSAMGVKVTGTLDAETALLLTGPFLQDVPKLGAPNIAWTKDMDKRLVKAVGNSE